MGDLKMLQWITRRLFKERFCSDKQSMALALRVSEGRLDAALNGVDCAFMSLVFEEVIKYCIAQEISVDALLSDYRREGNNELYLREDTHIRAD